MQSRFLHCGVSLLFPTVLACGSGPPNGVDEVVDAAIEVADAEVENACTLELRGRWESSVSTDLTYVADKDLLIVARATERPAFLDVSDPSAPVFLAELAVGGTQLDVQYFGDVAYFSNEGSGPGGPINLYGVHVVDISNPAEPTLVKSLGAAVGAGLRSCHNLAIERERELLFCASTETGQLLVLSLADPLNPTFVAAIDSPALQGEVHDMFARGDRLYAGWILGGMAIYDISNASSPSLIGLHLYDDLFTHNVWPNVDGSYVFSTDEKVGGHLRVWDIRNLSDITQVAQYQPNPSAIVHNVEVSGTRAYISHYTDGVKVLDVADPTAPIELAAFDFYDGPDQVPGNGFESFQGAFGVAVAPPFVYVGGTRSGVWILELVCPRP